MSKQNLFDLKSINGTVKIGEKLKKEKPAHSYDMHFGVVHIDNITVYVITISLVIAVFSYIHWVLN